MKENEIITIYILPGGNGDGSMFWYSWLKEELENKGFKNIIICNQDIISPNKRAVELKTKFSKKLFDETIIIGHSLGALTSIKWIELEKNKKFKGLILIEPSVKKAFETAIKHPNTEDNINRIKKILSSWKWKMDLSVVKKRCQKILIVGENKHNRLRQDWKGFHKLYANELGAVLIYKTGEKSHFTNNQEPQVLNQVLNFLNK